MKLATYKDGSRDGQLLVVSRDLSQAHFATGITTRMQALLDDWNFLSPQLEDLYATLNGGKARHAFAWNPALCMAPLPRACQWVTAEAPPAGDGGPPEVRMTWRSGDHFLGPRDRALFDAAAEGIGFEPGLVAVTGDVPFGSPPAQALEGVRLLMLSLHWTLPADADSAVPTPRPATGFSPLALTPDELGPAWRAGRVQLPLQCLRNGKLLARVEAGRAMASHFGELIAGLARSRPLAAGSLVGCGLGAQPDAAAGGLHVGDTLRIEMAGRDGLELFGAIEQRIGALQAHG